MKAQVKAFIPIDITDEMLLDSSIVEPFENEPAWDPDVEYAEFSEVSVIDGNSHLIYQSLQSINKGHEPATSPTWWQPRSNTNRFRMFDFYQGDPSVASSPMWFSIRPRQRINAIVIKNLKANVVEMVVRNGISGPIVYTLDAYLLARHATKPFGWCFKPFLYDKTVFTFNIPPVRDPVIWIKMDDPSGTCELERFGLFWKNFGTLASPTLTLTAAGVFDLGAGDNPVIPAGLLYVGAKLTFYMKWRKVGGLPRRQ